MLEEQKVIWFVHTNRMDWGKGSTISEAMKNAKANSTTKVIVTGFTLKSDTPQDIYDNIMKCYTVESGFGQIVTASDVTEEDKTQIHTYVDGFVRFGSQEEEFKINVKQPKQIKK